MNNQIATETPLWSGHQIPIISVNVIQTSMLMHVIQIIIFIKTRIIEYKNISSD